MSAALCRARSASSSIGSAAASARRCLRRGGVASSSRATSALTINRSTSWRPTASVFAANDGRSRIRGANSMTMTSAVGSRHKSAMPVEDEPEPTTNSTPFLLADIGEGISEVELLQWFVSPGDTVSQFDRICEVQSDKAAVEITSRFDGTIETLCGNVGDMMFVGKPLLYIATAGGNVGGVGSVGELQTPEVVLNNVDDEEDRLRVPSVGSNYSSYYEEETDDSKDGATASKPVETNRTKVLTSPAVRKLGKEHDIDLGTVLGTGPGGRILKADVLKIINPDGNADVPATSQVSCASEKLPSSIPQSLSPSEDTVIPIRGYNRLMVKSMTASLQVPHMVYADEINVDALTQVRDSLRPLARELGVPKLTYMPFFVKAASLALSKYPALNSSIDVEEMTLTYRGSHNVGVAVDTERGLAVPVVRGCEGRSVLEIAEELGRLFSLAAEGNLSEADIADPTFTLSNIGAIGGTYMSPVVLPPQVAIGAMGKIQRLPRFVNDDSDEVEAVRIMPVSWGGDHRAVDGATMARFSNLWKSYCENPSSMMFAMR